MWDPRMRPFFSSVQQKQNKCIAKFVTVEVEQWCNFMFTSIYQKMFIAADFILAVYNIINWQFR